MIDRLASSLRELASLSATELVAETSAWLRGDCADAVRLELDCPQQLLTPAQRAALTRLSDALEDGASATSLVGAVRNACSAIGLQSPRRS